MERLASAYEADPSLRQDLLQEIHAALWHSFHTFDNRCGLRTWVYRVAHNTAVSHVRAASRPDLVSLEEAPVLTCGHDPDRHLALSIADIVGISAANAGTKIHRVKNILTQRFHQGEQHPSGTLRTPNRLAGSAMENEPDHARELEPVRAPV
jgi:RNA polymerase sigma-70 factor (ECF subfamily)